MVLPIDLIKEFEKAFGFNPKFRFNLNYVNIQKYKCQG
jgi:hypothetical protein